MTSDCASREEHPETIITNPSKSKEVREYIKEQFKVKYSLEGVRVLLRKNGLKILKVFQFLNHVDQHADELKTLMVEKFQIVKSKAPQIVPEKT